MPEVVLRWLDSSGTLQTGVAEDLDAARTSSPWVWADITDPDDASLAVLAKRFDFHELAIEDTVHQQHRAKLDSYPSGLFLVWLKPDHVRGDTVVTSELDVFVGRDHLVTLHKGANKAIDAVAEDGAHTMRGGPDWTLHAIIDLLVDSTLPLVDEMGEQLSAIEERMLDKPRQDDLRELHRVRRRIVRMHRIVAPERDLLRGLAREGDAIGADASRYFQDVGDHVARVLDSVETYQDVGASVMDVYLSAQNNRMNEIMKQLTVVATIFMPLTLISGIYGMNLTYQMWPNPQNHWGFPAVVFAMLALGLGMGVYFRRRNWW